MSVICITNHNENIYNIMKKPPVVHNKSPRYKSKYRDAVKIDLNKSKESHKTMGLPEYPLESPSNFLKKRCGKQLQFPKKIDCPEMYHNRGKLAQIPKRMKQDENEENRTQKNFIRRNIIYAINSKPKQVEPKFIDTRYGDKQKLHNSGLRPHFVYTKAFGKTPNYILRRLNEKDKLIQFEKDQDNLRQPKCRYVTREERENLLEGLKQNWAELQKAYQGLPILTDTVPKVMKKLQMEEALKQLEKDIVIIERNPYIYVHND